MERLPSGSAGVTEPAPGDALRVELVPAPLESGAWAAYEAATRSYASTRAFIEYFERPARPELALARASGGGVQTGFLFERSDPTAIRVLGRFSAPSSEAFGLFVEAVFALFPSVTRVETALIDALATPRRSGRPTLTLRRELELRVPLPDSADAYDRSLAAEFLKRTRYYERRLARALPGARFSTLEREEIPREWVAEIVRLNRARMSAKGTESVFDGHYEEGIFAVARGHGAVTVLRDGARLCAGVINIQCGTDSFGWVIAHDDDYAKHRPGRLCALAGIRHLVSRGVKTHHFLLGDSPYKRELGGVPHGVESYLVLRSWAALEAKDVVRSARDRSVALARGAIDAADVLAGRVVGRPQPLKSLARDVARRIRRIGRDSPNDDS